MKWILALLIVFSSAFTWAALPPARYIILRATENNGKSPLVVEQEILLPPAFGASIKETWWIEDESRMRLVAQGLGNLKGKFYAEYIFAGGKRFQLGKEKNLETVDDSMYVPESYFGFRSFELFAKRLYRHQLATKDVLSRKKINARKAEDFSYEAEPFIRLSRVQGVVGYLFNNAQDNFLNRSGIWFEQDQFLIRKILFPEHNEYEVLEYGTYGKGARFPAKFAFAFNQIRLEGRVLGAAQKPIPADLLKTTKLAYPVQITADVDPNLTQIIQDFYERFRR